MDVDAPTPVSEKKSKKSRKSEVVSSSTFLSSFRSLSLLSERISLTLFFPFSYSFQAEVEAEEGTPSKKSKKEKKSKTA